MKSAMYYEFVGYKIWPVGSNGAALLFASSAFCTLRIHKNFVRNKIEIPSTTGAFKRNHGEMGAGKVMVRGARRPSYMKKRIVHVYKSYLATLASYLEQ